MGFDRCSNRRINRKSTFKGANVADTKQLRPHTRLLRAAALCGIIAVAAACPSPSQTPSASGAIQPPPPQVSAVVQTEMPMSMQGGKPADGKPGKPEDKPGEMLVYASQIPFGEGIPSGDIIDQPFPCEPTPQQCGGQASVRIRIVPSNFAPNVDWNGILNPGSGQQPKNGHFVAKVTNPTDYPFGPLRLAPNDVAYLWVGTVGNGNANMQSVVLYRLDGTRAVQLARAVRPAVICNKPRTTPAVHLYPMLGCDQSYPRAGASSTASLQSMTHLTSYFARPARDNMVHTSGLWVSCDAGCCQVQMGGVQ